MSEEDLLPGRRLARIAAISTLVGLIAVGCAFVLLRVSGGERAGSPEAAPRASSAIGMVEQTSIEDQRRGLAVRDRDRAMLDRYVWIDRDAGLAQRPIAEAIADVVEMYKDGGAR